MALLFCDGFGHVDDGFELLKWTDYSSSSAVTYEAAIGRLGDWGALLTSSDSSYLAKSVDNLETLITGVANKCNLTTEILFSFMDNQSEQVTIWMRDDGTIAVYRDTADELLAVSAAGTIVSDTWQYIEAKVKISTTVGTVDVLVDGVSVISETGLNTQDTANAYSTSIKLHGNIGNRYVDDFYICDVSGSLNNDFLGDIHIRTLYPVGDGVQNDFTPSTGVDNYALVDEAQLVDDTDHNESSTIGHKDLYDVTTTVESDAILAVQICAAVRNTDTGTMNVRTLCRSGTVPTDNEGSDFAISQTMRGALTIHEQEPTDSVAWTQSKINAAEFGIKVQS